jgi:hyperosmotically inducible protein
MKDMLKVGVCVLGALVIGPVAAHTDAAIDEETMIIANEDMESTKKEMGNFLSDSEITAKVKEKFIAEKLFGKEKISAMGIHVKTNKGIVTLTGKVDSKENEENAIKLTKTVDGVKDVKSKIKVKAAKKETAK